MRRLTTVQRSPEASHRDIRSIGRQYSTTPRSAARTGAQAHDNLAGIHLDPLGAVGGNGLLHGGAAHAARAVDPMTLTMGF
jgi:hypothetical protein